MSARISPSMVTEYASFLAEAKDDADQAQEVFADEARLEAEGAIVAGEVAESTRRLKENLDLVSSGLGMVDAGVEGGAEYFQLADAVIGLAETGLGMLEEGWQKNHSELAGLSNEALSLSAQAARERARLNGDLRSLEREP